MLAIRTAFVLVASLILSHAASAQTPQRAKYGQQAVRLFRAREFVRENPAPDFWALAPYYVSQPDEQSCSAACVAMAVNALRAERELKSDDKLATPASVVEAVPPKLWKEKLGPKSEGVTLDELRVIVEQVLATHKLDSARVETARFAAGSDDELAHFRNLLVENERSGRDVVLVNILQSVATGDPEGAVGHFAPIGAYDAVRRRVLLFDPDRQWYEPYWISDETLLEAMATTDPVSGKPRGLLRITLRPLGDAVGGVKANSE
jgi:hypothetical protein